MRPLVLVLAVSLAVAACSSSGDDDTTAGSSTVPAVPAATAAADDGDGDGDGAATTSAVTVAPTTAPANAATSAPASVANISCSVLNAYEITQATGESYLEGAPSAIATAEFQDACDWVAADGTGAAQLILVSFDVFEENRSSAAAALGGTTDVTVAGADAAYSAFDGSIVGMRLGERFVQVSVIDGSDQSRAVLTLAELAASRV